MTRHRASRTLAATERQTTHDVRVFSSWTVHLPIVGAQKRRGDDAGSVSSHWSTRMTRSRSSRARLQTFTSVFAVALVGLGLVNCSDSSTPTDVPDPQRVKVLVRFEGDGAGRVHSPNVTLDIDCSEPATAENKCSSEFDAVGEFQLVATPKDGSVLALWACSSNVAASVANCSGCQGSGACDLVSSCCGDMTFTVIARFEPAGASSVRSPDRHRVHALNPDHEPVSP